MRAASSYPHVSFRCPTLTKVAVSRLGMAALTLGCAGFSMAVALAGAVALGWL